MLCECNYTYMLDVHVLKALLRMDKRKNKAERLQTVEDIIHEVRLVRFYSSVGENRKNLHIHICMFGSLSREHIRNPNLHVIGFIFPNV